MGARGKRPAAELQVVGGATITAIQRPRPPEDLTDEQAQEWRVIVNRLPAEWFPAETFPVLTSYCRHIVTARRVAQLIEQQEAREPFDLEEYERLLKMQERESRALTALGRSMRLTQQSTYAAKKTKPSRSQTRRPWEIGEE